MQYIWEAGHERVMHIERMDVLGHHTMTALCGIRLAFNRSINAPFGLGRPVCKKCRAKVRKLETVQG